MLVSRIQDFARVNDGRWKLENVIKLLDMRVFSQFVSLSFSWCLFTRGYSLLDWSVLKLEVF